MKNILIDDKTAGVFAYYDSASDILYYSVRAKSAMRWVLHDTTLYYELVDEVCRVARSNGYNDLADNEEPIDYYELVDENGDLHFVVVLNPETEEE